jgi:hypothetical protein
MSHFMPGQQTVVANRSEAALPVYIDQRLDSPDRETAVFINMPNSELPPAYKLTDDEVVPEVVATANLDEQEVTNIEEDHVEDVPERRVI